MSTRAGFIAAILDNLTDDTPRLVFADFLQENGEPERAEFIRLQIEAARSPKPAAPKRKAEKLYDKHWKAWHAAVGLSYEHNFHRGFFAGVGLDTVEFAEKAAAILAVEPATFTLGLHPHSDMNDTPINPAYAGKLANNPHLKAVTRISSQSGGWGAKNFARLMRSPHIGNLKRLEFFEDTIGLTGVKAIVESPSAFVLEHLDLNESLQNQDDKEKPNTLKAVELIASSPRFASLKHLGLMFNGLGERSAKALLASKTLPRKMLLEIYDNPCEDDYLEALAERFTGVSDGDDDEDEDD